MDVIPDRAHPSWDTLQSQVLKCDGLVFPCEGSPWQAAINAGRANWVVFIDHRADVTIDDLHSLPQYLDVEDTPIWLQPVAASLAADRRVGECCSEAVSLCWNNPARYSLVCVRRSAISSLPAIDDGHPEAIWDWLIKAAGRAQPGLPTTKTTIGDWHIPSTSSTAQVSRPHRGHEPFVGPPENSIPKLTSQQPAPELDWLIQHIESSKPSYFVPDTSQVSIADSVAVKAGLLLWHDAADASHQLSQSIEGLGKRHAGDYWHAILHRREPDYSNAKYWFRQFHLHPVMSELIPYATRALQDVSEGPTWKTRLLGKGSWDPLAFVDLCEACAGREESPLGVAARRIQAAEMQLLMAATYLDASGCESNGTFGPLRIAPDVRLN